MTTIPNRHWNSFICEYKSEHETLAEIIRSAVTCEKIYLLAATVGHHHLENVFIPISENSKIISHYHVMVVIPKADKPFNVEDKIEGRLQHFIPTTAIVLDVEEFKAWIKKGHPFSNHVANTAYLIYGREEPLDAIEVITGHKDPRIEIESLFAHGRNKTLEFLAGAELYRIRRQNKMAAFMLHQSLEQMLRSLVQVLTGIEIITHNLNKLLRLCSMFHCRFAYIFKSSDGKSEKIFQLLQKAYVDGRYKDDFSIEAPDLSFLEEKIQTAFNIYEKIVKDFMKGGEK